VTPNQRARKSKVLAVLVVSLFLASALSVISLGGSSATAAAPTAPAYGGQDFYFGLMSNNSTLGIRYPSYASSTWPNWSFWGQLQTGLVEPNPGSGTTIVTVSCLPPSIQINAYTTCTASVSDATGSIAGEEISFDITSSSVPAPGGAIDGGGYCNILVNSCSIRFHGDVVGWGTVEATYWGGDMQGNSRSQGHFTINVLSAPYYEGWYNSLVSESGCLEVKPSAVVTLSQNVAIQQTNSTAAGQNGFSIQMNIFGGASDPGQTDDWLAGWDQVVVVALPQGTSGLWYYSGTVEVWNEQAGIVFDGPWLNFSTNQPAPAAGWTFDLAATYKNSTSYTMTGGQMKVYNALGTQVGSTMNIPIVMPPFPTTIPPQGMQYGMFTPFFKSAVYEVNLVGQYNAAIAKFNSGAGTITYSSSDGQAVQQYGSGFPNGLPCGYSAGNTGENSNLHYGATSASGNSLVQSFNTQVTTATIVSCNPASVSTATSISCRATVTGYSGTITGETLSWKTSGSGSFSSTTCILTSSGSPATIGCSVSYQAPNNLPFAVTTSYPGDSNNFASFGYASITGTPGSYQKITQNGCDNQYPTGSGWEETVETNPQVQGTPYGCGQWIDQQDGFVQSVSSTNSSQVAYQGIIETQDDIVSGTGLTFSVQMTDLNAGSGTMLTFWDAKCVDQGLPQNGPQICSSDGTADTGSWKYTMWSVGDMGGRFAFIDPTGGVHRLTAAGSTAQVDSVEFLVRANTNNTLHIYYNIGSGYILGATYSSPSLAWENTDGGEALLWASTKNTAVQYSSFAYYSVWAPNQVLAEGTFDNNMMNLARHYEVISGGPYSGDAVMTDTEAPPLVAALSGGTGGTAATLYSGMAPSSTLTSFLGLGAPSSTCSNPCSVSQTFSTGNTVYYTLTNGATDKLVILISTNPASTAWRTVYTIVIHSTWSSYSTGSRVMSLYLGNDLLVSGLNIHTNQSGTTYTVTEPFGLPGNRYVSRHITYVTSLLLSELGYGSYVAGGQESGSAPNLAVKLSNFMQEDMTLCHTASNYACSATTYTEYYGAMFPSYASSLSSNWYYQYSTFPEASFYDRLPYGNTSVSFGPLNQYGYGYSPTTQFAAPYISRLAITSSPVLLAAFPEIYFSGSTISVDGAWVISGQKNGFTPATQALRAEYTALTGGGLTTAEALLDSAGWDGMGTSLTVCLSIICTAQASYPTYDTATFLAAASVVGQMAGTNSRWANEARQAAGVLVAAMWPGIGYITNYNIPQPITDWRFVGGEMAAYEPLNVDPASYTTNQAGPFADVSGWLQIMGINGVQPPESAGFIPVDTEATGLTAQALYTFLEYLPNQPAINTFGIAGSPLGNVSPVVSGCSTYSTALTGYFLFNQTSFGDCQVSYTTRITLPADINYASLQAYFHVNGTFTYSGSAPQGIYAQVSLTDTGGNSYGFGQNITFLTRSQSLDKEIGVSVETNQPLPAGGYLLTYSFFFQGKGTFDRNSLSPLGLRDYVRIDQGAFLPNTLTYNFVSDANWNDFTDLQWTTTSGGAASVTNNFGTRGLEINLASGSTSNEYDVETISYHPIYYGLGTTLRFTGNITGQAASTYLCFGISTVSDNSKLFSAQASYADFCDNSAGSALIGFRNQGGAVQGFIPSSTVNGKNLQVGMEIVGKTLVITYTTASGSAVSVSFTMNWNTNNFYVYSYATTKATSTQHVYLLSESVQGEGASVSIGPSQPITTTSSSATTSANNTAFPTITVQSASSGNCPKGKVCTDPPFDSTIAAVLVVIPVVALIAVVGFVKRYLSQTKL